MRRPFDNPELYRFYQREQRLTRSQTLARRMLIVLLLAALAAWGIWGSK